MNIQKIKVSFKTINLRLFNFVRELSTANDCDIKSWTNSKRKKNPAKFAKNLELSYRLNYTFLTKSY